jgi:Hint module
MSNQPHNRSCRALAAFAALTAIVLCASASPLPGHQPGAAVRMFSAKNVAPKIQRRMNSGAIVRQDTLFGDSPVATTAPGPAPDQTAGPAPDQPAQPSTGPAGGSQPTAMTSPEVSVEPFAQTSPDVSPDASPDVSPDVATTSPTASNGSVTTTVAATTTVMDNTTSTTLSSAGGSQNATQTKKKKSCFPASATILLESGLTIPMSSLAIGDSVHVGAGAFSKVFMFTHKHQHGEHTFIQLSTSSGNVIRASPGHYIHVNDRLAPASVVVPGDKLELASGQRDVVVRVESVRDQGLYNPQTLDGDIVVDGIRASTYTTAVAPTVAHTVLFPLRALYAVTGWSTTAMESGADALADLAPGGVVAY